MILSRTVFSRGDALLIPVAIGFWTVSSLDTRPAEAETTPYPYQTPPWMLALREKLAKPMSVEYKQLPLGKAVADFCAATGLRVRFAPGKAREAAEKPVSLNNKDLRASAVLQIIVAGFGLTYQLTQEEIVVREPGPDLIPNPCWEAEETGAWIEHLRKQRFPSPEERKTAQKAAGPAKKQAQELKEKFEGLVKALRSTKVSREFAGTSLAEFVVFLRKACGVNIAIDPIIDADKLKVNVKGGSRTAERVLDEVLRSLGLGRELREDVVYITSADRANTGRTVFQVWKEETVSAERKLLALELTRDLERASVPDFVKSLAADIGVKVFPDSRAWETEVKFTRKIAGLTVKQIASLLRAQGIELVVYVSPPPYQTRHLPESVAEQPKKPPGLPDADWSIYLFRKTK